MIQEMKTCGTCRYWGKARPDHRNCMEQTTGKLRVCQAIIHDSDDATGNYDEYSTPIEERNWLSEEVRQELIHIRDSVKAVVVDGSNYYAALKCREDFGCILHEPLEKG